MRLTTLLYHDVFATHPRESGFEDSGGEHYKLTIAEFDRHLDAISAVLAQAPCRVTDLAQDSIGGRPVALTFDDGGLSYYRTVADRLDELGWRGHCFMTTARMGSPGFLHAHHIRELHERGHVIGSHSVTHPTRFAACSRARLIREWTDSKCLLEDVLGAQITTASVPGGYFSAKVAECAAQAGFVYLFTSEPINQVQTIGGCHVFGRFTLRRSHSADYAARLIAGDPLAMAHEWTAWNTKKLAKHLLGTNYQLLARRISASRRSGSADRTN